MSKYFAAAQGKATSDAISKQVRDQIDAARMEARAAQKNTRIIVAPTAPNVPGGEGVTIQSLPFDPNQGIPPQVEDISIAFFVTVAAILIFWPITRALARRMDRASTVSQVPAAVTGQLAQLTQAVDAIALEVERISEGQRFTTRLLSDQSRTALSPAAGERPPVG